jgi:hypothetical protein
MALDQKFNLGGKRGVFVTFMDFYPEVGFREAISSLRS